MMKQLILIALLAVALNHVNCSEVQCALAISTCSTRHSTILSGIATKSCEDKMPLFKCYRDQDCDRDDESYKTAVNAYSYSCCGSSAIAMYWSLTAIMVAVVKYFTK